ncbi:Cna B-type domain-containing protein [Butyrivibrio sp. LC3010]|uniref:Cna B-type domain-containing protein n=1 Tax=Butyrivibrio sp. LC3010 TaxID=1280680 RepID=UPI00040D1F93|nr:Cna B-type domain-containing protein [Butyrivibrio sp. LC3010]
MKIFSKLKKLILGATVISMSALLALPGATVNAGSDNNGPGHIDMNRETTLSVYYYFDTVGDIPGYGEMDGVNTKVYKIASISENGEFTLLPPYDSLGLEVSDMRSLANQEKWDTIITEAGKCVAQNNIQPSYQGTSGNDGFTRLGKVDKGLYYGVSDPLVKEGIQYKYFDFLSVVPGPSSIDENGNNLWDGTWTNAQYDVIAIPKRAANRLEEDPEVFAIHKQWVDDGGEDRPDSIKVKIFCDGAYAETVELSNENNWKYSWNYEKGHTFTVEEENDNTGYTPTISQNENTIVIVNTKKPKRPDQPNEPEKPNKPNKPGKPSKPNEPVTPDTVDSPGGSTPPDDGGSVLGAIRKFVGELPEVLGARRLPQTGQLWWPIPVLAIMGIILIVLGFRNERRRKND